MWLTTKVKYRHDLQGLEQLISLILTYVPGWIAPDEERLLMT